MVLERTLTDAGLLTPFYPMVGWWRGAGSPGLVKTSHWSYYPASDWLILTLELGDTFLLGRAGGGSGGRGPNLQRLQ